MAKHPPPARPSLWSRLPTLTLIADDYAMTAGVSRGILRLLEHGRIPGTGAMTNRPHWKAGRMRCAASRDRPTSASIST